MNRARSGDRVAFGHRAGGICYLPSLLLLLAGYTITADAGPLDDPPHAPRPPAGDYDSGPARTRHADELDGVPLPQALKVLLRDGIRYDFDRYQSVELDFFGRLPDGPGGFGQVFLLWRIALD